MSQSERLQYIDTAIREKGIVTVQEVAQKFEVSPRTVKRDIEYLRERISAPVEYVTHKKGYCYSLPFDYFTFKNERILLFYIFLTKLIESPTHFPFIDKNIINNIKKYVKAQYLPLISKISYKIEEWEELNIALFSKLFAALRDNIIVTIHYADAKGTATKRDISPQHFIHYEGRWYCIAYDEHKKQLRTFLLSRIKDATLQNKKQSKVLSNDELQKYICSTYGIYKGISGQKVCVRFYEPVSNIVKKQVWHPQQAIRQGNDQRYGNYIELVLPVYHPQELLGKILRYGKNAEIVSPKEIRQQWLDAITEAYTRFCQKK